MFSSLTIIAILVIVSLVIMLLADNIEGQYRGNEKDEDGLIIVKGCVLALPVLIAIATLTPVFVLASVITAVLKPFVTYALKRI